MSRLITCLAVVIILLSFRTWSAACSMAGCLNDGDEMRPTFTIIVTHDEKPLAGVNFHIVAKGAEQFSGITDDQGSIHVQTLAPGLYWLNGDLLGTGVVYTCFHVSAKPSRKAKIRLTYTWGDEGPATSKIAGRLVASQPGKGGTPIWNLTHRIDVPIAGAGLTLRDPISHAVYLTTSDQDGHFFFEGLPSGTYVLHIEGGSAREFTYDPTDSVVELTNTAKLGELLFRGGPSGCGRNELELQLFD
ncbi:MAG: SpaA isopeptide-forming pilin-related protein [Candidatus Sulfotelmatobacter sp.]